MVSSSFSLETYLPKNFNIAMDNSPFINMMLFRLIYLLKMVLFQFATLPEGEMPPMKQRHRFRMMFWDVLGTTGQWEVTPVLVDMVVIETFTGPHQRGMNLRTPERFEKPKADCSYLFFYFNGFFFHHFQARFTMFHPAFLFSCGCPSFFWATPWENPRFFSGPR